MKSPMRIGLSQRVDVIASYGERRDALDQQWGILLEKTNHIPVPLCNGLRASDSYLQALDLDGYILTGGNDLGTASGAKSSAPERDVFEQILISHAAERRLPVLAVCRGFQMLNNALGGKVEAVEGHVATVHRISPNPFGLVEVNSYHAFGISRANLAESLIPLAMATDGTIEAAQHKDLPWTCVMWHPERCNPDQEGNIALIQKSLSRGFG